MFDHPESGIELSELEVLRGEREDQLAYLVTTDEMTTGWTDDGRHALPDLSGIPPGPFLAVLLEYFDRKKGTADLHLFGLHMGDARAIGRQVNGHMISLTKEDRSGRTHDQLRADIAKDLLLGELGIGGGKGLVDIHIPASTLDGGTEPGLVGGLGPVTADTACHIVAGQPDADHQITLLEESGQPTHIYTLSRRATKRWRDLRHQRWAQVRPRPSAPRPRMAPPASGSDRHLDKSSGSYLHQPRSIALARISAPNPFRHPRASAARA